MLSEVREWLSATSMDFTDSRKGSRFASVRRPRVLKRTLRHPDVMSPGHSRWAVLSQQPPARWIAQNWPQMPLMVDKETAETHSRSIEP